MPQASSKAGLGVLVALTWVIVAYIVWRHICHWTRPQLQKCYVRIVLLLPVFSLCALIVYLSPHYGVYLEAVRALAEGYALYAFFVALIIYSGGEAAVCRAYEHPEFIDTEFQHSMFCGLWTWTNSRGEEVLRWHKKCIYQLMIIKPLSSLSIAIIESNYDIKQGAPKTMVLLLAVCGFASMAVLMRTLLAVYIMTKARLEGMEAIRKFSVVKLLVFITITQGLIINMIVAAEGINPQPDETIQEAGSRWVSLLGIIEMFLFAFIFAVTFTYKDFSVLPLSLAANQSESGLGARSLSQTPEYLAAQAHAAAKIDVAPKTYGSEANGHSNGHGSNGNGDIAVGVKFGYLTAPPALGRAWKRPSAAVMSPCSAFCQIFALSDFFTRPLEESEDTPLLED